MNEIKIVIAGPRGRMGSEAVKLVEKTDNYELVAVVDHRYGGKVLNELEGISSLPVPIYEDMANVYQRFKQMF